MIPLILSLALLFAPAPAASCKTIDLDNVRHHHVLDHAWDAIDDGAPTTLYVDRAGADANRRAATKPWPTVKGYDRDEYPPASAAQGGTGADIRYVRASENRSAGASMGAQLRTVPDGGCFRFERP